MTLKPPHTTLDSNYDYGGSSYIEEQDPSIINSYHEDDVPTDPELSKATLQEYIYHPNIAEKLSPEELLDIEEQIYQDLQEDELSVDEWVRDAKRIMKMAKLENEPKNHPWPHASNVKLPLVTIGMTQWSNRALPELIKGKELWKADIQGQDPLGLKKRHARRLMSYMNYKTLRKMSGYLNDKERMFNQASVIGTTYTKVYYDVLAKTTKVSMVPYELIVVNDYIQESVEKAPRITEYFYLTKKQVLQYQRAGVYRGLNIEKLHCSSTARDRTYMEFIEQHTEIVVKDIDKEYPIPVIVISHKDSREIFRIICRFDIDSIDWDEQKGRIRCIEPICFYTDYHFIFSPDGRFHSMGFGTLLFNLSKAQNSILNQLIDAGTLANTKTNFIDKGLKIKKGDHRLEPGKNIICETTSGGKVSDHIHAVQYGEPSSVLFQLLGLLMQQSKDLTSITEALLGQQDATNASPTTVLAMIQQGLTQFIAINKRMFRSFDSEGQKLLRLERIHPDVKEYIEVTGVTPTLPDGKTPNPEYQEMFRGPNGTFSEFILDDITVLPVADINSATQTEKLAKAQIMLTTIQQLGPNAASVLDLRAVVLEIFDSIQLEIPERFIAQPQDPTKSPEFIKMQLDAANKADQIELKKREQITKDSKQYGEHLIMLEDIKLKRAEVMKIFAEIKEMGHAVNMEVVKEKFNQLDSAVGRMIEMEDLKQNGAKVSEELKMKKQKMNKGASA